MKAKKAKAEQLRGVVTPPDLDVDRLDQVADAGGQQMQRELREHHSVSPVLTGGDVDANWQAAESTGEETPGGHMATPDQDEVDEIGRAYGMEIPDTQELHRHDEILAKRDAHRWELDKRSTDEETGEI